MLHDLLQRSLGTDPNRPILECDGAWTAAAELERLTARLASGLAAMRLEEGDRVAILLPNGLEAAICYLACFRMRLVIVPLDYQYQPLQIGYALGHSGAAMLIVSEKRISGLDETGALKAASRVVVVGGGPTAGNRRPFESLLGAERVLPSAAPHDDAPGRWWTSTAPTCRPEPSGMSASADRGSWKATGTNRP